MAHMSVEALICPLQGILSIAQREGNSSGGKGKMLLINGLTYNYAFS